MQAAESVNDRTNDHGIVSMLRAGFETESQRRATLPAALLLVAAWVGFLAWIGPYVGSPVAAAILRVAPREAWLLTVAGVLAVAGLLSWRTRQRGLAILSAMLLAYHLGTGLSVGGYALLAMWVDTSADAWALRFMVRRAVYGLAVCLPMALVWLFLLRGVGAPLRFGNWRVLTKASQREAPVTWLRMLGAITLFGGATVFLMMQAAVSFEPIRSGQLIGWLPAILAVSLVNASAEEWIFRGFALPAAITAAGVARGVWLIGLWFGLHHWGLSVQILASLPGALLLGIGSVFFGKSVGETGGIGWAIAMHAVFDVAIFSAFYGRL
jgi:membrane protease YdiL (CAAX protease family)